MKIRPILLSVLAVISLGGAASCEKLHDGQRIRFTSRSQPDAPRTKTAYSGQTYKDGTKTLERIDWVSGDQVVIAMKNDDQSQAYHRYDLTGISPNGRYSEGGLEPADGTGAGYGVNGLQWGSGTHDFWAAYPSTATIGDHTLKCGIPATQVLTYNSKKEDTFYFDADMSEAFMVASMQSAPTADPVVLDFYPGFTTFEFTVGANTNIVVNKFEMETEKAASDDPTIDTPLVGTAVATFDPSDGMSFAFSGESTSKRLTATFVDSKGDPSNPSLTTETKLNFEVLALPVLLKGVRIKFTLSNGDTHSLDLKQDGEWIPFPACKKVRITGLLVPGKVWLIEFDDPREQRWIVNSDIEIGVE